MIDNFIGKKCFGCFSVDLVLDFKAGDIICRNCGEIVSDRCIDEGNEVLSYTDGDGKSQASRSSGMVDMFGCMQTMFVNGPENLRKSLEKAQQMSSDRKEKSVFGNLNVLNEMCAKLNLIRTIQDTAIDLFTKTVTQSVVSSKNKDPIVASCIYLACRVEGYPRTIDEVSRYTGIATSTISHMQATIARALSLSIGQSQVSPESLVNRIAAQLQLSHTVASSAREMCANITRYELFTTSPQTVVGGVLLWVCALSQVALDVQALSAATMVTASSLKTMFGKIHNSVAIVAPSELLTRYGASSGRDWRALSDNLDKLLRNNKLVVSSPVAVSKKMSNSSGSCSSQEVVTMSDLIVTSSCSPASASTELSEGCLSSSTSTESISSSADSERGAVRRAVLKPVRTGRGACSVDFVKEHGSLFIPKKKMRL